MTKKGGRSAKGMSVVALFSALVLGGCSTSPQLYEGGGDYRFIGGNHAMGAHAPHSGWFADWTDKYQNRQQRAELKDKFQDGDTISIYLKSAMFSYISESIAERAWANHGGKKVNGQIAIVANIASEQGLGPMVSLADVSNPGRVIFYSGDVEEGQTVNQSFGPVYGPVKWNGGPIILDVTVLEIDEEERQQTGAVIGSLAKLGTAPGVSFSPTALALLNTLGSALVQSNRDDIMGRFRLTLTPDVKDSAAYLPTLKEGDLALIRKSARGFNYPWRTDCSHLAPTLDPKEKFDAPECGWFASYNPGTGHFAPANNHTNVTNYMVFTFVRNMPGPNLVPNTTAEQLLEKIRASSPTEIAEPLKDYVQAKKKDAAWDDVQRKINQLADGATSEFYREHVARDLALTAQCIMLYGSARGADKAALDAVDAYCRPAETFSDQLSPSDYDLLARKLGDVCGTSFNGSSKFLSRSKLLGDGVVDYKTLPAVMTPKVETASGTLKGCGKA